VGQEADPAVVSAIFQKVGARLGRAGGENAYFKNNQKNLKQTKIGENAYFKNNQKNLKQTKTKKT